MAIWIWMATFPTKHHLATLLKSVSFEKYVWQPSKIWKTVFNIGFDYAVVPLQHQTIFETNVTLLLTGHLGPHLGKM